MAESILTMKFRIELLRFIGWTMVVTVIFLSLIKLPPVSINAPHSDKWLHLTSYFILAYWFLHVYAPRILTTILGFMVMGGLLEWIQSMTGYRYFEWLDLLMNICGVFLALLLFSVARLRFKVLMNHKLP